jgi:Skp family chaperone for outer membrane proteins
MKAYVLIVASFLAVSVYGQGVQNIGKVPADTSSASVPVFRVATVDLRQAIVSTAEGQQASKDLQAQFSAVITELQDLNKKVNDLKTKIADAKTTDKEKAGLTADLKHLTETLDNKNKHVEEEIKAAQTDVVVKIGKGLVEVIDAYAKSNGYTAILDSSSQSSQLLFASPSIDITKEVVTLYDQSHPAKVTPAPAAK